MFSITYRQAVRSRVLEWALADNRIVAGAVVGSLAHSEGDRWSDVDLTFGVSDATTTTQILSDYTKLLVADFEAISLFDLPRGTSIYRVFLLPGCLQVDLSFTPASDFGAIGPSFKLLFGVAVDKPHLAQQSGQDLLGYAVHHALRARICIERGRLCQAEYWISASRDYALSIACLHRDLPAQYGRGFDELPSDLKVLLNNSLVTALEREPLLRALDRTIDLLLLEGADEIQRMSVRVKDQLREMATLAD
jgi:hypothetical protein